MTTDEPPELDPVGLALASFEYPCPGCESELGFHEMDCEFEGLSRSAIEEAYTRILAVLIAEHAVRLMHDIPPYVSFNRVRDRVSAMISKGGWRREHTACIHALKRHRRLIEEAEGLLLVSPESYQQSVIPQFEPMKTVFEVGPIDGCKDYAVYSMVSWCEMVGLSWEQTCTLVREWLEETDAWDDESWEEASIAQLLEGKRHVYDHGLGWKERASNAKRVIDESGIEPRLDAAAKQAEYDAATDSSDES